MKDIGARLKKMREMRGLLQEYIADCLNVSSSTISRMESNCMTAKLENICDYCKILGISIETLFADDAKHNAIPVKINLSIELTNTQMLNEVYNSLWKSHLSFFHRALSSFPINSGSRCRIRLGRELSFYGRSRYRSLCKIQPIPHRAPTSIYPQPVSLRQLLLQQGRGLLCMSDGAAHGTHRNKTFQNSLGLSQ